MIFNLFHPLQQGGPEQGWGASLACSVRHARLVLKDLGAPFITSEAGKEFTKAESGIKKVKLFTGSVRALKMIIEEWPGLTKASKGQSLRQFHWLVIVNVCTD
jgi:hypothetical protein